jgi:hypothetical protein
METILTATCEIAAITLDDGVIFDIETATAESIRDEAIYGGVRVTMTAQLATARPHFHVDTNVGDPISPAPKNVHLPRLLGGEIVLRGYPLVMVHAEKIVTAIARGTVNTRWRDFGDIHMLARHHAINGSELAYAIRRVADHRKVKLRPLAQALDDYGQIGQQRWTAWRRRQRLEDDCRSPSVTSSLSSSTSPIPRSSAPPTAVHGTRPPRSGGDHSLGAAVSHSPSTSVL